MRNAVDCMRTLTARAEMLAEAMRQNEMRQEDATERLRAILERNVRALVDQPDKVSVQATISDGGNTVVLTIDVAAGEVGKVIGKKGRNSHALRTLLEAVAAKYKQRVVIEISDDQRRSRRNHHAS